MFWCRSANFPSTEAECNIYRYDRRADSHPLASNAPNRNEQQRRAGELTGIVLNKYYMTCDTKRRENKVVTLQMEALQRIHIFRLSDVYSLLDCLYGLCGGRLQQVCFAVLFLLLKIYQLSRCTPGGTSEKDR